MATPGHATLGDTSGSCEPSNKHNATKSEPRAQRTYFALVWFDTQVLFRACCCPTMTRRKAFWYSYSFQSKNVWPFGERQAPHPTQWSREAAAAVFMTSLCGCNNPPELTVRISKPLASSSRH